MKDEDWFILLVGRKVRILCFNFFMSPSLSQKRLAMTLGVEVCPLKLFPSSSLQLWFSNPPPRFPSFLPPEGCTPRTPIADEDKGKHSGCEEHQRFGKEICTTGLRRLMRRFVLMMKENLWANYVNGVKDVHFIIILITVPEKIGGIKLVKTFILFE